MARIRFGTFLAPHHPVGEHPTLQFQRDLRLAEHLDKLGFDEFWCGEHHSSGWEMIASPELFLAIASERTKHQTWHWRRFAALPPPLQRRAAHRAARPHDLRARDLRHRPRRPALRRADLRHRLHASARPPGRSNRHPETALRRRAHYLQGRMVRAQRRAAPDPALSGRPPDGGRFFDQSIRHAACRKVRHGRPVHRLDLAGRPAGIADPMVVRRRGGEEA